jgi:hypothetical protein
MSDLSGFGRRLHRLQRIFILNAAWLGHCSVAMFLFAFATADVANAQEESDEITTKQQPYRLAVVTDDDFLTCKKAWCDSALARAQGPTVSSRPELKVFRFQPAGMPIYFNQGHQHSGPRRALCFWLDEQSRIMNFCVGIPDAEGFQRLTEEADEFSIMVQMQVESDSRIAQAFIRKTCVKRATRHYRDQIQQIGPEQTIAIGADKLSAALAADIQERFLLEPGSDFLRWISIQQHAEARRYWCAAMLPAIVNQQFDTTWREIAECVWGAKPWYATHQDQDWAAQINRRNVTQMIALQIDWNEGLLGTPLSKKSGDQTASRNDLSVVVEICSPVRLACLLQATNKKISMEFKSQTNPDAVHWIVLKQPDSDPTLLPARADQRLVELMKPQK